MEAQLQQSIPKKTHQEIVANMQATIDGLGKQVQELRTEIQSTSTLKDTITGLGNQLASQANAISSLTATIADLNRVIEVQKSSVAELTSKLSESTVPASLYDETLSKFGALQERVQNKIERTDYTSLQKKYDELLESFRKMVPRDEYQNLQAMLSNSVPKESFEALQETLSKYVPREQLAASEAKMHELEVKLQNYVPRTDYEELTAKIGLLTQEVSSIGAVTSETEFQTNDQVNIDRSMSQTTTSPAAQPEITEIQSQLSEIKGVEETGSKTLKVVDQTQGFVFSNTKLCAISPVEFLHDLEVAPLESIESHSKTGDFERWFKDVIADDSTAEALRSLRESNCSGDDLRSRLVAVISPRYKKVEA